MLFRLPLPPQGRFCYVCNLSRCTSTRLISEGTTCRPSLFLPPTRSSNCSWFCILSTTSPASTLHSTSSFTSSTILEGPSGLPLYRLRPHQGRRSEQWRAHISYILIPHTALPSCPAGRPRGALQPFFLSFFLSISSSKRPWHTLLTCTLPLRVVPGIRGAFEHLELAGSTRGGALQGQQTACTERRPIWHSPPPQ